MQDQILFSVIIPTYNRASLLRKAIQSLVVQTSNDWELLVIDDGSTDNTRDVVNSFDDSKIHYFYQQHKERSTARNLGIKNAKGQYICFLDDDDYFLPDHLKILEKNIREKNYPVAIFRTGMISKYSNKVVLSPFYDPQTSKHPIPFFLKNMAGIHTLCYHRQILIKYQFDERWFHFQDTHLLIRCLLEFPFFQVKEHTVVYVRYPEMGSLGIFKLGNAEDRTENNVKAIKDLFEQGGEDLLKFLPAKTETYLVAKKYLDHANGALYVGRKKLAMQYFHHSLKVSKGWFLCAAYLKFVIRYCLAIFK